MPQQFAFVSTDDSGRIQSSERQLIRRHCMRQKNKQPDSRRSRREAARAAPGRALASNVQDAKEHSSAPQPIPTIARGAQRPVLSTAKAQRQQSEQRCRLPQAPPSDWTLLPFPDELDVPSQKLMHEYFLRNPIRDLLYPYKAFGIPVDLAQDPSWCFRLLRSERLCLRAILLLTSASDDLVRRRLSLSDATRRHLRRTLPVLNQRLSEAGAHMHDILLYVVSILASIAVLFGDYAAAEMHATGLSKIIRLRGGFGAVDDNPLLQLSIDRLNFSSLLVTRLWTPIYGGSSWRRPTFSAEIIEVYRSQGMLCLDGLVEPRLAAVFHDLQCTTILINKHYWDRTPIDGAVLRDCLGFVQSTLVELESRLDYEPSRCLCLGTMAFLATTFRSPDSHELPYNNVLARKLQLSYGAVKVSAPELPSAIDTWLMYVCLISSGSVDGPHARASGMATLEPSWVETRRVLKEVMWIDAFHDDLGRRSFEALMARRGTN